jgi:Kef-type K+ transport system membrane component KefB
VPDVSFVNLLVVAAFALAAPMVVGFFRRIRIPAVVLEIVAGIAVGPHGFGWVKVDLPIQILALMGLAFLLFLAGLEIDIVRLRGRLIRLAGLGFLVTVGLGIAAGYAFDATGVVKSPLLVGIALMATSLGLVVPVLKDAGQAETELGQLTIAGASVADFGAIVLLTFFFSGSSGGPGAKLLLFGGFAALVAFAALALSRIGRSMRLEGLLVRLQDTTAEIRVRFAVLLLVGFVALAERLGLETILGAFIAGAILNLVDRDSMSTHPNFHLKLEAIGYGFLVPVFFVSSGLRFDLDSLVNSPSAFARVTALPGHSDVDRCHSRRDLGGERSSNGLGRFGVGDRVPARRSRAARKRQRCQRTRRAFGPADRQHDLRASIECAAQTVRSGTVCLRSS